MGFVVKRPDPKTAQLNDVPEGEHTATLVSVGEPSYYGSGNKLKLPLRFQIDGHTSGVVLRRIRLTDHSGKPYEEFGPNTDMAKFLDMARVEQPDDAIGLRFVVRVKRRGAFCDVTDVLHLCTPPTYSTDVLHQPTPAVIGNSLSVIGNSSLEIRDRKLDIGNPISETGKPATDSDVCVSRVCDSEVSVSSLQEEQFAERQKEEPTVHTTPAAPPSAPVHSFLPVGQSEPVPAKRPVKAPIPTGQTTARNLHQNGR